MNAVLRGVNSPPAANAGWQVFAPANTVVAGATFYFLGYSRAVNVFVS
jgi:hypothetical protein